MRLERGHALFRIHRAGRNPWWFSDSGIGRFDLRSPLSFEPVQGTCYLARHPLGAFIEVFREKTLMAEAEIAARRIATLLLPVAARLADCTESRARAFGLTAEIHSTPDYRTTQAWATAFSDAGFDGIHYYLRHDPGQHMTGVALFGPVGEAPEASGFLHGPGEPIDSEILREVYLRFGIVVVPAY